ncbi:FAD/NAD-binding domain-containing protein [Cylindrobasidium torrendii FP15055 ss-10]|uniref:FAD/NAD-binding domain-containing protein n=1 Tax=Cylindrobasidium torrendii FP15055 ss-10 TaxID=1314674 RepID=A0A0D7B9P0_9AGAR|nr:FAD/NAD-binding domain-containing protein [Cylindrobasidium torrendii FP15055 ss-10]
MRVAVVGSGVSGLAATWALNEHSDHEVHLFEADDRPGGHANTVPFSVVQNGEKKTVNVDSGFIVFNPCTYPNFLRFLRLDSDTSAGILPTEMTFAITRDRGKFEWAGDTPITLFCQPKRLLDVNMWRMLYDILRFNANGQRLVASWAADSQAWEDCDYSIGEYLHANGYSDSFKDNYLIPMTAAIWSTSPDKCSLGFPARTLIQFLHNHHLLQLTGKPKWLTFADGSHTYVRHVLRKLSPKRLHLSTPVNTVRTDDNGVILETANGEEERFDRVIFACHSNTARDILKRGNISNEEAEILGLFKWNANEAVLHSDPKLMPKSHMAWCCWNYLTQSVYDGNGKRKANNDQVSLTYGMNALQHIPESTYGPVLVTLNPPFEPDWATVRGRWRYEHPVLDQQAMFAQNEMKRIQDKRGLLWAGAYLNFGFHEDGWTSGLVAALKIGGVKLPFELEFAPGSVWEKEAHAGKGKAQKKNPKKRPSASVFSAALVFDALELSGIAEVIGKFITLYLGFLLWLLSVVGINLNL